MSYLVVRIQSAHYDGLRVLNSIEFELARGEIATIVGPNASGKSTVLKTIVGLVSEASREVLIAGRPVRAFPQGALEDGIALLPQTTAALEDLSVDENLILGGHLLGRKALHRQKDRLFEFFPELRELRRQRAGNLSGGEARLLGIARILMPEPSVLLLDEPSIGLDPSRLRTVFDRLIDLRDTLNTTVVVAEQRLSESLRIADQVIALLRGKKIFSGCPTEFKSRRIETKLWHS